MVPWVFWKADGNTKNNAFVICHYGIWNLEFGFRKAGGVETIPSIWGLACSFRTGFTSLPFFSFFSLSGSSGKTPVVSLHRYPLHLLCRTSPSTGERASQHQSWIRDMRISCFVIDYRVDYLMSDAAYVLENVQRKTPNDKKANRMQCYLWMCGYQIITVYERKARSVK